MLKRNIIRNLIILLIVTISVSPIFFFISVKHFVWPICLILIGAAIISYEDHNFHFGEFKQVAKNVDAMESFRNPNLDWLNDYIREIATDLKISPPELWVAKDIDTCVIYGNHRSSKMIFPSAIIAYETKDVVKACVCHEIGHIVNYDSTIIQAINMIQVGFVKIPILIMDLFALIGRIPFLGLIAVILVFLMVALNAIYCLILFLLYNTIMIPFSRFSEYSADKFAVNYLRNGEHLTKILEKDLEFDPKGWRRWINFNFQPTIKNRIKYITKLSLNFEN